MRISKIKTVYKLFMFLLLLAPVGVSNTLAQQPFERVLPQNNTQIMLSFSPLVEEVAPAVVNIYTTRVVQVNRSPLFDDPFFQRFFGENNPFSMPKERVMGSLGSGVIVRENGVIVTNNHVIGEADSIRVVLADRREYEAEVILADERTDLAILQINTQGESLPFIPLLDSDTVKVGDVVIAIGNPFGVGQTVTSGIVSATARSQVGISNFQFFIQTDAAVNPGNSGGALVGLSGELIGINTAIYSRAGENNGISFAIPANMVRSVVEAALSDGEIVRPWLGATGQVVNADIAASLGLPRPGGVIIDNIYADGPADKAGILPSDVIIAVGGREVLDPQSLNFRVATTEAERRVPFTILRNGRTINIYVILTKPPENPPRNIALLDGRHPFQGVKVANLSPKFADELGLVHSMAGVIVLEVDRRSPAARRQLVRAGDIVLYVNGQEIKKVADLKLMLIEPVADYTYRINRGGRQIECAIIGLRSFSCRQ
jgi:serine protease Do